MAEAKTQKQLSVFMKTGIFGLEEGSNAVFVDPVSVLNLSYTHFRVTPSSYYSRFFQPLLSTDNQPKRKRKHNNKKNKPPRQLNQRELAADQRHQRVRPLLINAHECLLRANDLLLYLGKLRVNDGSTFDSKSTVASDEQSFVELGSVWQAPLFEISLHLNQEDHRLTPGCESAVQNCEKRNVPAFGSLVANETNSDMEAEFLNCRYIIPKQTSFYMSDLKQIHGIVPGKHECGFNLIVIDPPWENGSANQKLKYPTLPDRYFLSLPIKRLSHADGALVALWVTNKEKLRVFVEKDLFPKWGVEYMTTYYWLKVKADGSLISELDLFHHRPYECLIIGCCYGKDEDSEYITKLKSIPNHQVFISIPGDYSRKPPIGEMLREYIPGLEPARCLELFARELLGGWTSWGNEPLRFQDSRYFSRNGQ